MDYTYQDVAKMIDHSLLNPTLTSEELEAGCRLALAYDVASVCIMPYYLQTLCGAAARAVGQAPARRSAFRMAATQRPSKQAEAEQALADGCQELDMVVNISQVLSGHWDYVRSDIKAVIDVAHERRPEGEGDLRELLSERSAEDPPLRNLRRDCSADWVKTSTGYGTGGATLEDLRADAAAFARLRAGQGGRRRPRSGRACWKSVAWASRAWGPAGRRTSWTNSAAAWAPAAALADRRRKERVPRTIPRSLRPPPSQIDGRLLIASRCVCCRSGSVWLQAINEGWTQLWILFDHECYAPVRIDQWGQHRVGQTALAEIQIFQSHQASQFLRHFQIQWRAGQIQPLQVQAGSQDIQGIRRDVSLTESKPLQLVSAGQPLQKSPGHGQIAERKTLKSGKQAELLADLVRQAGAACQRDILDLRRRRPRGQLLQAGPADRCVFDRQAA